MDPRRPRRSCTNGFPGLRCGRRPGRRSLPRSLQRLTAACAGGLAAAVLAGPATAAPPAAVAEAALPSCGVGSPPLRVAADAERALLDDGDKGRFQEAARKKYPLYERGGLVPARVLLVRRGGGWQYMTLWTSGPSGLCVAAVFAAERFDFTPAWVEKYRPRAGEADD